MLETAYLHKTGMKYWLRGVRVTSLITDLRDSTYWTKVIIQLYLKAKLRLQVGTAYSRW
jgi:hypothetical protein